MRSFLQTLPIAHPLSGLVEIIREEAAATRRLAAEIRADCARLNSEHHMADDVRPSGDRPCSQLPARFDAPCGDFYSATPKAAPSRGRFPARPGQAPAAVPIQLPAFFSETGDL